MKIRGRRVIITPMKLEDIHLITNWGKHDNPLFFDYNLSLSAPGDLEGWYDHKVARGNSRYYSVFNDDSIFIGYIGIKNIRRLWRDAVLGVVFDPNYIDQGYGTDAISAYLDYYFNMLRMRTMYLEVAEFNQRAIKCYQKCGFRIVDRYLDLFFDQHIDRNNIFFLEASTAFQIMDGKIYNYIYKMRVDRDVYGE
ncbi:MAG: GNAT family N-acetyltransferase [Tissierellia bacterium]|nr:GNAT family N-acetyltransferase [Tissierellia bacterium]